MTMRATSTPVVSMRARPLRMVRTGIYGVGAPRGGRITTPPSIMTTASRIGQVHWWLIVLSSMPTDRSLWVKSKACVIGSTTMWKYPRPLLRSWLEDRSRCPHLATRPTSLSPSQQPRSNEIRCLRSQRVLV